MTNMYFDVEIAYTNEKIIQRLKEGKRIPNPSPKNCKIITIQYQLIGEDGKPKSPLRIFKEWESSEEEIIKKIASMLHPQRLWEFVPVGHNIYFDLGMLMGRAKVYGINYDPWFIYNDLPTIDIKHICIGMNAFRLKDSGLDKFSKKETSGLMVPVWYHNREYDKIIDYVKKEAEAFMEMYAKLRDKLPEFRKQLGLFNNSERTS